MPQNQAQRGASKGRSESGALEQSSWTMQVLDMKTSLAKVKKDTEYASVELNKHDNKLDKISETLTEIQSSVRSVWTAATVVKWAIGVFLAIATITVGALGLILRALPAIIEALRAD